MKRQVLDASEGWRSRFGAAPRSDMGGSLAGLVGDYYAHIRPAILPSGALLLAGMLLDGFGLLLLVPLLGLVLHGGSGSEWVDRASEWLFGLVGAESQPSRLALIVGLFALVILCRGTVLTRRDVALERLQVGYVQSRRLRILHLLAGSRWETLARLRHSRIVNAFQVDLATIGQSALYMIRGAVSVTMIAAQALLMLLLAPLLALFVLLLMIATIAALRPILDRTTEIGKGLMEADLAVADTTSNLLSGLKLAQSHNLQFGLLRTIRASLQAGSERKMEFVRQRSNAQALITFAGAVVVGLVILAGVGLFAAAPAILLTFLFLVSRMIGPLGQLQLALHHMFYSLAAFGHVQGLETELRAIQAEEVGAQGAVAGLDLIPRIEFHHVSFWYEGLMESPLTGPFAVDLSLESGEFVGLVGPSGSGKTTFCDLLAGLVTPRQGWIEAGKRRLDGPMLATWRASLSYVSQEPFLLHDTIDANLLWARPEATAEEVWAALGLAGAADFVRQLPAGLNTVVGERGSLMSGGERQRIALARALLRKPRLLILDEATNAIDVAGERSLLERLAALPEQPTIVMVAHRPASLAECDRILEFEAGRIVRDSDAPVQSPSLRAS